MNTASPDGPVLDPGRAPARRFEARPRARPRRRTPRWTPAGRRLRLRPAAAIACEVSDDGVGGEFDTARSTILRWVASHAGPLPAALQTAPSTASSLARVAQHEAGGVRVEAVDRTLGRGRYFGLSLEAEANRGRPVWRTVTALYRAPGGTFLRTALEARKRAVLGRGPMCWVPAAIHDLCESPGLVDYGWRLVPKPWIVDDEVSVEGLIHLIGDPDRSRPVFASGLSGGRTDIGTCSVDPWDLAQRTAGLAHVVVLTGPMTYLLSDRVGRRFSVFGDAFRTYRPGCRVGVGADRHPIALSETVRQWPAGGPRQFVAYLAREAARMSLSCQMASSGWSPRDMMAAAVAPDGAESLPGEPNEDGDSIHPLGAGEEPVPGAAPAEPALRPAAGGGR